MRLFVDTNVLLELILGRNNANDVRAIGDCPSDHQSVGSRGVFLFITQYSTMQT